jgi:hypothetical protein
MSLWTSKVTVLSPKAHISVMKVRVTLLSRRLFISQQRDCLKLLYLLTWMALLSSGNFH